MVFTMSNDVPLSIEQYTWQLCLNKNGIPMEVIEWCRDNCRNQWGWWFDASTTAYIGFTNKADMVEFWIINQLD